MLGLKVCGNKMGMVACACNPKESCNPEGKQSRTLEFEVILGLLVLKYKTRGRIYIYTSGCGFLVNSSTGDREEVWDQSSQSSILMKILAHEAIWGNEYEAGVQAEAGAG